MNAIPSNGNVTAALKSYVHGGNALGKSIHRTQAIIDMTYHDAFSHGQRNLMPGYVTVKADPNIAYCAHNRYNSKPKNGC